MRSPHSLRARLVLVTVALMAVGLTVAGIATYGALRNFLSDRVNAQLQSAYRGAAQAAVGEIAGPGDDHHDDRPRGPGNVFDQGVVGYYHLDGSWLGSPTGDTGLPATISRGYSKVTVADAGPYRFYADSTLDRNGDGRGAALSGIVAVGVPLREMDATLRRLVALELIVGMLALAGTAALGYWLVRAGLRPLTDIEHTAGAIAEGDLARRIADENPRTEVGRLGHSLNVMLGRIEESFAEREASERRLRQFVADASHELQTPLTSVRGYAELFRRGAADRPEDLATAMRRIEAESERMGVLVDDLLLLARLDQGRPIEHEPVDLTAAVRELAGDSVVVDPGHPVTVDAPTTVAVVGDEVRLRQVVSNLLSNARRHTPDGTAVTVLVRQEGNQAVVAVRDEGPGLAPEHAARVFERFYRSDASRVRTSGGTGLGLAIVAAIAEAHGGTTSVESTPGAGATFTVRLPVDGPPTRSATSAS